MIAVIFEGRLLLKKNPMEYDLVLEKQQQVWEEKKKLSCRCFGTTYFMGTFLEKFYSRF